MLTKSDGCRFAFRARYVRNIYPVCNKRSRSDLWPLLLVSARRRRPRRRGGLMVYRPSFSLSFLFRNWSQPLLIRSPTFFTDTCVMPQGCKRRSWISKILLTYLTGCKKPQKHALFNVFFTEWPHVFDHCAKTVWARRMPITDLSSTINCLSFNTTLITVVWVVFQNTARNQWPFCECFPKSTWLTN